MKNMIPKNKLISVPIITAINMGKVFLPGIKLSEYWAMTPSMRNYFIFNYRGGLTFSPLLLDKTEYWDITHIPSGFGIMQNKTKKRMPKVLENITGNIIKIN